jgi:hypothetical protein
VRLADGREVIVRANPGTSVSFPALPTSCTGVSCRFGLTPQGWLGVRPNGDASFTLRVGQASFPLVAGEQFDLTQIDPLGVAAFSIRGIDPGEQLDPEDPMAFVTGATFMRSAKRTSR